MEAPFKRCTLFTIGDMFFLFFAPKEIEYNPCKSRKPYSHVSIWEQQTHWQSGISAENQWVVNFVVNLDKMNYHDLVNMLRKYT